MSAKKRLTAIDKWDGEWFSDLHPYYKLIFLYLCDKCDFCGIWKGDIKLAHFQTKVPREDFCWDQFVTVCDGRIVKLESGKFFIVPFCAFQYPNGIQDTKNFAANSAFKILMKLKLLDLALSAYPKPEIKIQEDGNPF